MSTKEPKMGSFVGMSFDHGPVKDTPYGSALNLKGVVPMLQPYGVYQKPAIWEDKPRMEALINEKSIEYRDMWPNELDETIRSKIGDYLTHLAFCHPKDDISHPKLAGGVIASCLAFAIDDVMDQLSETEAVSHKDMKQIMNYFNNLLDGVYERPEDIPNPVEPLVPFNAAFWKFVKNSEKSIPNFHERNQAFKDTWQNAFYAYVLTMEKGEDRGDFSAGALQVFLAHQDGWICGLEYFALLNNATVSDEVRNDLLFQRVKLGVGSACNLMNDIFGVGRDINLKQDNDSTILSDVINKGMSLQGAFDKGLGLLIDDMNDMRISIKKLKICYPDDENLMRYLECAADIVDGQFYWYTAVTRYGEVNLKVVEM